MRRFAGSVFIVGAAFALAGAMPSFALQPVARQTSVAFPRRFLSMLTVPEAMQTPASPITPVVLPDGPGKDTAKRVCSACHAPDLWAKQRHTHDEWAAIVDRMISKGAEGTDDEFGQVLDYLTTNFGPVTPAK
jgi:mono/diheme cytochrome c family protein